MIVSLYIFSFVFNLATANDNSNKNDDQLVISMARFSNGNDIDPNGSGQKCTAETVYDGIIFSDPNIIKNQPCHGAALGKKNLKKTNNLNIHLKDDHFGVNKVRVYPAVDFSDDDNDGILDNKFADALYKLGAVKICDDYKYKVNCTVCRRIYPNNNKKYKCKKSIKQCANYPAPGYPENGRYQDFDCQNPKKGPSKPMGKYMRVIVPRKGNFGYGKKVYSRPGIMEVLVFGTKKDQGEPKKCHCENGEGAEHIMSMPHICWLCRAHVEHAEHICRDLYGTLRNQMEQ